MFKDQIKQKMEGFKIIFLNELPFSKNLLL